MKKVTKKVGINPNDLIKRNKELEDALRETREQKIEYEAKCLNAFTRIWNLEKERNHLMERYNQIEKEYLHIAGMYNVLVAIVNRSIPCSKDTDEHQQLRKLHIPSQVML